MSGAVVEEGGFRVRPRSWAWAIRKVRDVGRFGLVGASGLVVNQLALLFLTEIVGIYYLLSAIFATFASTSWNFVWAERWAFARRTLGSTSRRRFLSFLTINLALIPARLPALWLLTEVGGINYGWANAMTLAGMFGLRLLIADQWLWRSRSDSAPPYSTLTNTTDSSTRHRYDVAGIVQIESDIELRELAYFRTAAPKSAPDIRIRVDLVAPRPTTRVRFHQTGDEIVYREHLGPLAANFAVKMGEPIEIRVSPILGLSPHVVYTNIVEAFLRFLLVSRGYVLLHSAALADSRGVTLLSAQTDTGKTSTVISLVRDRGYRFLSDDMTIIDPRGYAISYPKPMTLSFHTMGVAKDGRLSRRDRLELAVQSRLHSKSGRTVGRALGDRNLPIMTLNSIVQLVVPPPKYRIDALMDCAVGGRGRIRHVAVMSRGERAVDVLPLPDTVRELIENTDDAYGFPPFSTFAPRIRIGDDDYGALRRKEVELLTRAMAGVQRWRVSVPGHEWAQVLPSIIDAPSPARQGKGNRTQPLAPRRPTSPREAVPVFHPKPTLDPVFDEAFGSAASSPILIPGPAAFTSTEVTVASDIVRQPIEALP